MDGWQMWWYYEDQLNMGGEKYKERIVCLMNMMLGMEEDMAGDLAGTSIAALLPATTGQQDNITDVSNHN